MRFRLPFSDTYSLQLAVEELLNLIPLEEGVKLLVAKSEKGLEIEAALPKSEEPYLSKESIKDDLSYSILEGLCERLEEGTNESNDTVIRMTLKQNTI